MIVRGSCGGGCFCCCCGGGGGGSIQVVDTRSKSTNCAICDIVSITVNIVIRLSLLGKYNTVHPRSLLVHGCENERECSNTLTHDESEHSVIHQFLHSLGGALITRTRIYYSRIIHSQSFFRREAFILNPPTDDATRSSRSAFAHAADPKESINLSMMQEAALLPACTKAQRLHCSRNSGTRARVHARTRCGRRG